MWIFSIIMVFSRRESVLFEPVLKAMEKGKKAGKFRFAGITTHMNEPEVIHAAVDSKSYDVILTAYNYQQKHYTEVRDGIAQQPSRSRNRRNESNPGWQPGDPPQ